MVSLPLPNKYFLNLNQYLQYEVTLLCHLSVGRAMVSASNYSTVVFKRVTGLIAV